MEVINLDKNGNVIPDLSKKVIPKDLSDMIVQAFIEQKEAG
jgi:hypothetical protein